MGVVMSLLGWSELEYCYFMYDMGVQYLEEYLHGDKHTIGQIEQSKIFWGWWKNHWFMRERQYVEQAEPLSKISRRLRLLGYKGLHNPRMLAAEMNTAAVELGDSYANMLGMIFKEERKVKS